MSKVKDLKKSVEDEIQSMLKSQSEPSEGRMKLLALGIKMCALNAKLEESEYGSFFGEPDLGDTGSIQKGPKPANGKRADRLSDTEH